jgi:hypothetical protein
LCKWLSRHFLQQEGASLRFLLGHKQSQFFVNGFSHKHIFQHAFQLSIHCWAMDREASINQERQPSMSHMVMGFCANANSSFSGCALLPSFCCWTAEQSKIGVMHYFIPSIGS